MASSLVRKGILLLAIGYTAALTIGSLIKPVQFVENPFRFMDKLLHAGAYFGLSLLWVIACILFDWIFLRLQYFSRTGNAILFVSIVSIGYGTIIEILQGTMTAYRTPDGWDILANTTGVLLTVLICSLFINKLERLKLNF
ncbi:MAG: VanZ family protein [Flavobacteriales bacterium]|jgi:VanZ family protein